MPGSPSMIEDSPQSVAFPFLKLAPELRLRVYDAATSTAPQHRRATLDLWPGTDLEERQTYITWIRTSLPCSLLSTCRLINQEATPLFLKAQNELCLQPLRFIVNATGIHLLTSPFGLIGKILNKVILNERVEVETGQPKPMRERPRLHGTVTPVFQSIEIDYLVFDCARQIAMQRQLTRTTASPVNIEIGVNYGQTEPNSRLDAIQNLEKFWEACAFFLLGEYNVAFGLFLKQKAGTDLIVDADADLLYTALKDMVDTAPLGCTILEPTEEEWLRDWTETGTPQRG